jgi:pimeloyl-ACP methyl ester carboxylesterase
VIRLDLPAYGLTGPFPKREYSIPNYVDFVKDFLDDLTIDHCIMAGNSLGGRIAWSFTADHPDMVDRLILIDASGYPLQPASVPIAFKLAQIPVVQDMFTFITPRFVAAKSVENVYADKSKVTDEIVDRYFELTLREGNRQAFIDRFKITADTAAHKKIKTSSHPTLVLWGAEDQLIPLAVAQRFHGDLPNDTLVILDGLGHVPMEENPMKSIEPVKMFLNLPR